MLPFQHDKKEFNRNEIRSFIKIGPECFESIYFGARIDTANKEKIIQLARTLNPNIFIYQMKEETNTFNLIAKQEMNYTLNDYIELLSNLHTNKRQGKKAPHKAIMLISIINLIVTQHIQTNEIVYTEELEECFIQNWKRYIGESSFFRPNAGKPYWHLNSEPFWQLIPYEGGYETIVKLQKRNPYSPKIIREHIKYAVIDKNLFKLLQDKPNSDVLRNVLINSLDT